MARKPPEFQPGLVLHEVISGAFRARGTSLEAWCKENGLTPMNVRNAAFGVSRTDAAKTTLDRVMDAAGREFILKIYRDRMLEHCAQLQKGVA